MELGRQRSPRAESQPRTKWEPITSVAVSMVQIESKKGQFDGRSHILETSSGFSAARGRSSICAGVGGPLGPALHPARQREPTPNPALPFKSKTLVAPALAIRRLAHRVPRVGLAHKGDCSSRTKPIRHRNKNRQRRCGAVNPVQGQSAPNARAGILLAALAYSTSKLEQSCPCGRHGPMARLRYL
jgi:hypothetical protein